LPPAGTPRHPVLRGLDRTDIISFGGTLLDVTAVPEALVPLTFVPPLPIYPPEFCWMRTPQTTRPALVLRDDRAGGRVAYLPADIDRCAARYQLPDHLDLLANLARWAAGDNIPLAVSGPGYVDCHLYRQDGRTLLHLVNLTHARGWPGYVEEHPPVGPFQIAVECDRPIREARMLVAGSRLAAQRDGRWVRFTLPSLADHELIVLE
jgi:hypothetical protein